MDTDLTGLIKEMVRIAGIDESRTSDFADAVRKLVEQYQSPDRKLPDKPVRDYLPRQETILDYLRSPDGFGPWLERGVLTRPLIREKSFKAYTALNNWLRQNQLPDDLKIPTKSEVVQSAVEGIAGDDVQARKRASLRDARRLERIMKRES